MRADSIKLMSFNANPSFPLSALGVCCVIEVNSVVESVESISEMRLMIIAIL